MCLWTRDFLHQRMSSRIVSFIVRLERFHCTGTRETRDKLFYRSWEIDRTRMIDTSSRLSIAQWSKMLKEKLRSRSWYWILLTTNPIRKNFIVVDFLQYHLLEWLDREALLPWCIHLSNRSQQVIRRYFQEILSLTISRTRYIIYSLIEKKLRLECQISMCVSVSVLFRFIPT